jgi:hypothetical protein
VHVPTHKHSSANTTPSLRVRPLAVSLLYCSHLYLYLEQHFANLLLKSAYMFPLVVLDESLPNLVCLSFADDSADTRTFEKGYVY